MALAVSDVTPFASCLSEANASKRHICVNLSCQNGWTSAQSINASGGHVSEAVVGVEGFCSASDSFGGSFTEAGTGLHTGSRFGTNSPAF